MVQCGPGLDLLSFLLLLLLLCSSSDSDSDPAPHSLPVRAPLKLGVPFRTAPGPTDPPTGRWMMSPRFVVLFLLLLVVTCCRLGAAQELPSGGVHGYSLHPPYFNLAEGTKITATATCGEEEGGRSVQDLYCKLVGGPVSGDPGQTIQVSRAEPSLEIHLPSCPSERFNSLVRLSESLPCGGPDWVDVCGD